MSFKKFFLSALASLAALSLVFTVLMLIVIDETSLRVANGRLASDAVTKLQAAQTSVASLKIGLLTESVTPDAVEKLLNEGEQHLQDVKSIHLDLVSGAAENLYTAALLRDEKLQASLEEVIATVGVAPYSPAPALLTKLNEFQDELATALQEERNALALKRNEADAALTTLASLVYAAVALFLAVCAFVSLQLRSRLDPAVAALETGLAALKDGKLETRVNLPRRDEFGRLAEVFNFTAQKLSDVRDQGEKSRQLLEERVAARTADLSRAMQQMQDLASERSKLLSDLGHELRTPLTIIRGEADVALRMNNPKAELQREAFEIISSAAEQMGTLLDDLLDVSKNEDPALSIKQEITKPDTVAQAALSLINKDRKQFNVHLDAVDADIYVDPLRLQQAILVLLENAIAYSQSQSEILVRSNVEDKMWQLEITDFGVGISSDDVERIFERGYRGDVARKLRPEGLGYGLSIAHTLIERQGGTLTVRSKGANSGSTFTIAFETNA